MASTGTMQQKMPKKSLATSRIGSQLKWLASRVAFVVSSREAPEITMKSASRSTPSSEKCTPRNVKSTPERQKPDIRTVPTMAARNRMLMPPSTPMACFSSGALKPSLTSRENMKLSIAK